MTKLNSVIAVICVTFTTFPAESSNMCRFRDEPLFPRSNWNHKAGAACYFYCPPDWFLEKAPILIMNITIGGTKYAVPYTKIANKSLTFNHTNEKDANVLATTFKTEALYLKWLSCARNGDACCERMNAENILPTAEYPCPMVWDAWTCFDPAKADTVSEMPCPDYTSSANKTPCILYSTKQCWKNGTWNQQTDYGTCAAAPVNRRRHSFHVIVLYVSIVLSVPAIVIFFSYRNLRILRVILHRNLLMACVIRNVLVVVQKELVILDSLKIGKESKNVMLDNGVPCRILAVFVNISANAIFACMLLDAFYLHKLIVRIFSPDPNIYIMYGIGIALSVLPTAAWATLYAINSDEYCWTVDSAWYQWIPDGFRIGILVLNIIMLLDIFRGLLTKLRHNVNTHHTKSTLKVMSFLLPLFGVPFILTANRDIVDMTSCLAGDIYYYVSYSLQALQGFMVAVLYCYWNKESQNLLKGSWRKMNIKYQARFSSENNRRRTTNITQQGNTRNTYVRTSVLPRNSVEENRVAT